MQTEKVTNSAAWKAIFQQFFNQTPKKDRKTSYQIKQIRVKAKLHYYEHVQRKA
jgi:hypothetical protein